MYAIYNESPSGLETPADPRTFFSKIKGMNGDHAADQKKLFKLMKEYKHKCDREVRGEADLLSMSPSTLLLIVWEECE